MRARRVRVERRDSAATGGHGISRMSGEAGRGDSLRMATSMPPALTLRAVANSRNSRPLRSRLRTKTGMASGSRLHWRRSFWRLLAFMLTRPQRVQIAIKSTQTAKSAGKVRRNRSKPRCSRAQYGQNLNRSGVSRHLIHLLFTRRGVQTNPNHGVKVQSFATLG